MSSNVATFEHATAVLHFKERGFALSRKDVLQGLDEESASHLAQLGTRGWELVSAVPFTYGGMSEAKTDAVLTFFKRTAERMLPA